MKTISLNVFDEQSIDTAIAELEAYENGLDAKARELCERLAQMGALYAEWNFTGVLYAGEIDYRITVEELGENRFAVNADGKTVLFMEFGAGITKHGSGHPKEGEMGMGPGTYPGQVHAFDKQGWWFGKKGHWTHTYGNAPGMPMYNAAQDLKNEILQAAREVFST